MRSGGTSSTGGSCIFLQCLIVLSRKHDCLKKKKKIKGLTRSCECWKKREEWRGGGHGRISCEWQKQEGDISLPRFPPGHTGAHPTIKPSLCTHTWHWIPGRLMCYWCFPLTHWLHAIIVRISGGISLFYFAKVNVLYNPDSDKYAIKVLPEYPTNNKTQIIFLSVIMHVFKNLWCTFSRFMWFFAYSFHFQVLYSQYNSKTVLNVNMQFSLVLWRLKLIEIT